MDINPYYHNSPARAYSGLNPAGTSTTSAQSQVAADPDLKVEGTSEAQPKQETAANSNRNTQLTQAERQLLMELQQIDTDVRNHEMAHLAAGGSLITSGASFTFKRGPDGNNYAVAGEVGIDTAEIPGDPRATVQKMQQVKSAAMAPASPSAQDLKVASRAAALAAKASSELTLLLARQRAGTQETQAFGNQMQASDSYTRVNNLPEKDTSTFKLAV